MAGIEVLVTITVEDDGPGGRRPHGASGHAGTQGHGILGMRERALALGGELQVGPSTDSSTTACMRTSADRGGLMIEVLLADDQPLVRAGLRVLFEGEPDIAVTGEAANGEEVLRLARDRRPDGGADGHSAYPSWTGCRPRSDHRSASGSAGVKVLILTTFESDQYVFERPLRAGAGGFLLKDAETDQAWLHAVQIALATGDSLLAPSVTRRLIAEFLAGPESRHASLERLEGLTEREREIMALVAEGLSNGQIAERLTISPATVKTPRQPPRWLKLRARDRAQLVVLAYQTQGAVVAGRTLADPRLPCPVDAGSPAGR